MLIICTCAHPSGLINRNRTVVVCQVCKCPIDTRAELALRLPFRRRRIVPLQPPDESCCRRCGLPVGALAYRRGGHGGDGTKCIQALVAAIGRETQRLRREAARVTVR